MRWRCLPLPTRRYPFNILGRNCSEPSPGQILFGLMSIWLNLDSLNDTFLRLQVSPWNWSTWEFVAREMLRVWDPYTHILIFVHLHNLVAKVRIAVSTTNSSSHVGTSVSYWGQKFAGESLLLTQATYKSVTASKDLRNRDWPDQPEPNADVILTPALLLQNKSSRFRVACLAAMQPQYYVNKGLISLAVSII